MRWVVVGAGTAGSVVAHRLSERTDHHVTIVEAGPDLTAATTPAAIDSIDYVDALGTERLDTRLQVTRRAATTPIGYPVGRGSGGSSAVNGMLMDAGDRDQYRRWGWHDVDDAMARVRVPATPVDYDHLGMIDRLLLAEVPGARRAELAVAGGRRVTTAARYLDVARERPNVTVRTGQSVERVALRGGVARGVVLDDGTLVDADAVVLSAGALVSPAILLRSRPIARLTGVQDHPSATLTLHRRSPTSSMGRPQRVGTGVVATLGDLHFSGMNRVSGGGELAALSAASVSLLRPRSRGYVTLDDAGRPLVHLAELDDVDDLRRLADGVERLVEIVTRAAFTAAIDRVTIDESGTPLERLASRPDIEAWLLSTPTGSHVHASASCPMGSVVDTDGAVIGADNLFVVDASVFPEIPAAPTSLPTLLVAERLAPRLLARFSA